MIARIAVLLLAALPAAAEVTDVHLPLAVGNSWTYSHEVADDRFNHDGSVVNGTRIITTEFTISVLRTEVIDGETYYVISEVPGNVPRMAKHFIGGKKLRWDGDDLKEHDGTSEISLYRFGSESLADLSWQEYRIPATHQDTLVRTFRHSSPTSGLATQMFFFSGYTDFFSDDGWDIGEEYGSGFGFSRLVIFVEEYGIQNASEQLIEDDAVFYNNDLYPVSAVFHSQDDGRNGGDASSSEGTTVLWSDYYCYYSGSHVLYDQTCGWSPTSTSSSSWGAVKGRWK